LCNFRVRLCFGIETLDYPRLFSQLLIDVVKSVVRIRPEVVRFAEIVWEYNVGGDSVLVFDSAIIADGKRRVKYWASYGLPHAASWLCLVKHIQR
jgi:hypothetical protein